MHLSVKHRLDTILSTLVLTLFAVLPFSIAIAHILVGLILIALLAKMLIKRDISTLSSTQNLPVFGLLAIGLFSLFGAVDVKEGISTFVSPLLKYAVVYFAVLECAKNEKTLRALLIIILIGGTVNSAWGLYQYSALSVHRITALFENPNPAGTYLAIYTVLSFSVLVSSKHTTFTKAVVGFCTLLGLATTILTMSRGALLGLGAAFIAVVLVALKHYNGRMVIRTIVVFAILIALLIPNPNALTQRFASITDLNNSSNRQRVFMLQSALEMFQEKPILGWGLGNFKIVYKTIRKPGAHYFTQPHNLYLLILAEMGFLGLMTYIWLIHNLVKCSLGTIGHNLNNIHRIAALSTLLSLVTVAVHSLVDSTLLFAEIGIIMSGLAGATVSTAYKQESQNDYKPTRNSYY